MLNADLPAGRPPWVLSMDGRRRLASYGFLLPAVMFLVAMVAYPLYLTFQLSFHDVPFAQLRSPLEAPFTTSLYARVVRSPAFVRALQVTAIYTAIASLLAFVIGFATALLLNRPLRGRRLARVLLLLPWPIPASIAALMWMWIFETNFGILNLSLLRIGVLDQPVRWLATPLAALAAVTATTVWKGYPFYVLMILAGLQAIPQELYESAQVDGAGAVRQLRHITLPGLRSIIGIAVVLQSLWIFSHVDIIRVMTNGGPYRSTETLAVQIYENAFQYFEISPAAVVGVITLFISLGVVLLILPAMSREFF
jgi:multiple sugar transport system permease protein